MTTETCAHLWGECRTGGEHVCRKNQGHEGFHICLVCVGRKRAAPAKWVSRPRNGRDSPFYGDPDFPGRGILKCLSCGRPYIEHRIGPCEKLGTDIIYAEKPSKRGRRIQEREEL